MTTTSSDAAHFMYDAINLELPSKPPLPAGYDLSWTAASLPTSGILRHELVEQLHRAGFHHGNRVLFDDTGLNNPAINLTNALAPGAMTVYA